MANIIKTKILLRNDEISNWTTGGVGASTILAKGEAAVAILSNGQYELRIGNNTTWDNSLSLVLNPANISNLDQFVFDEIKDNLTIDTEFSAIHLTMTDPNGGVSTLATTQLSDLDLSCLAGYSDLITSIADAYVTKTEHETFVNDTGLSAANVNNRVVTAKDINGLNGAMHFLGVIDASDPTVSAMSIEDIVVQQITSISALSDINPGDVVVETSEGKEYIFADNKFEQFGYESLLNDLVQTVSTLNENISSLSGEVSSINNSVTSISTAVSNIICADLPFLSDEITGLSNDLYNSLSGQVVDIGETYISSVTINGQTFDLADHNASLSIVTIDGGSATE